MVVIAIIGVLATISLVGLRNAQAKRRDAQRIAGVRELVKGMSLDFEQAGTLPVFTGCIDGSDAVTSELRVRGILGANTVISDPVNPSDTGKCYYYVGNGGSYTIRYTLEADSSAGPAGDHMVTP